MPEPYDYIGAKVSNLEGYSYEFLFGAGVMPGPKYRECMVKAIQECDHTTLMWLAYAIHREYVK